MFLNQCINPVMSKVRTNNPRVLTLIVLNDTCQNIFMKLYIKRSDIKYVLCHVNRHVFQGVQSDEIMSVLCLVFGPYICSNMFGREVVYP